MGCYGEQNSQGQGAFDGMVVEYDSSLNVTKQIYVGGSDNDFFNSITKSIDGGYIVSGYSYSNTKYFLEDHKIIINMF